MSSHQTQLEVVEDNPADARLVRAMLREPPEFQVAWSHSTRLGDALEHLREGRLELMLLDLGLPDSQGLEGLRRIREADPLLPVIILSGAGEDDLMASAVAAGAQDYMLKSELSPLLLKRTIRHALERKRSELALIQSERRCGDIVNNSPDLIFISRLGRVVFVNPAGVRMLRAGSAAQILGRDPLEFFHPEFPAAMNGRVRLLLECSRLLPVLNERMVRCDGTCLEVEVLAGSYMVNGELEIQVTARDITARVEAERALSRSERNLARAQQIARVGSWERDLASGGLHWSQELRRILGLESGAPPDYDSFMGMVHPDDRAKLLEARVRALDNTGRMDVEHRVIRPDGEVRWLHELGEVARGPDGVPERLLGTAQDITERKAAEEKLRQQAALLDHAQDAILVLSLDHHIRYWNKGAERIYGWRADEAEGADAPGLLHRETRAFHAANLEVLSKGAWHGELAQFTREGKPLDMECRWTLVRGEGGKPESVLAIHSDITQRKRLESQFLRAQRMESIGAMAGGIAHNLNNVLAPIVMSVDVLGASEEDPERRELLGLIEKSAKRGAEMIRQVLSFAQGVDGRRSRVNLTELIQDLAAIARETFPKNIRIELRVGDGLWDVEGDATQIHQVLLNFCVNSRDAMPRGGVISITAENFEIDAQYAAMNLEARVGPHLKIEVSDTGCGIPPEIIDKIFDPFFTTKEQGKGTGLGLSTSMAIIKSHQGFLRVGSKPGQGSSFSVYFPALEGAAELGGTGTSPQSLPRGKGELVLVVDDEPTILQVTQHTLEHFGYRVLVASDGSEAVSIYARHRAEVAVVLTDMMMPVMDGPATIKVLRHLNPKVRVIGASGISSHRRVAQATAAGLTHFLPKPYSAESLLLLLRQVLDAPDEDPGEAGAG